MRKTSYEYRNFDLHIERGAGGRYLAQVRDSPGGRSAGAVAFVPPFTRDEVAGLVRQLDGRRRDLNAGTTADGPRVTASVRRFGEGLFRAVFTEAVDECLRRSLREIDRYQDGTQHGLRILLSFHECPELADLPWEFLFDPVGHHHLCQSERTPLVRYLPTPGAIRPLPVTGPVRVLAVIASRSTGPDALDVEGEWAALTQALRGPISTHQIIVDRVHPPTLKAPPAARPGRIPHPALHRPRPIQRGPAHRRVGLRR